MPCCTSNSLMNSFTSCQMGDLALSYRIAFSMSIR